MAAIKGDRLLWIQGPRLAVALFVCVLVGGTAGYTAIEGWSAWDAFYMTVITVTTVGYREVHRCRRAGQVFTTVLAVAGVGIGLLHLHAAAGQLSSRAGCTASCTRGG